MAAVEVAPAIPGFSFEQNASLQAWVMGIVNERMQLAGTVVSFVNKLNDKQTEAVAAIALEAGRMDVQVASVNQALIDMRVLKEAIEKTHIAVIEITAGTSSFADSTRAEFADTKAAIEATSLASKEAHDKAEWLHSQVGTLVAKTEATFVETERKSLAQREEIRVWSDEFASKVQEMCRTGEFKFDAKPAVVVAKHDKKEVSVWKLVDGVTKPDFRHWIDSVDSVGGHTRIRVSRPGPGKDQEDDHVGDSRTPEEGD